MVPLEIIRLGTTGQRLATRHTSNDCINCRLTSYIISEILNFQIQSRLPDSLQVGELLHHTATLMGLRSN